MPRKPSSKLASDLANATILAKTPPGIAKPVTERQAGATILGEITMGLPRHILLLSLAFAVSPAVAQPEPAGKAAITAAQSAFEALPEAERRAIQDDLSWTGLYNGTTSGNFGGLTLRAIQGFQRQAGVKDDGMLDPAARKLLAARASEARARVGFKIIADPRTGVRIGVPTALLTKPGTAPSGSRWQSADGRITLDTRVEKEPDTLETLYDKSIKPAANRKVTYKLLKPDFYVATGETATGKFYTRMAKAEDGRLRGFSVGYDKALAGGFDRIVIAIANSFEPFPSATAPAAQPPTAAAASQPAAPVERGATGVLLAQGQLLTASAALSGCKSLTVGGQPARIAASDAASGLALVAAGTHGKAAAPALGNAAPAEGAAVVVLSADSKGAHVLSAHVLPGSASLKAPLQLGGGGSAVLDRSGALVGLVTADPSGKGAVFGVLPQRSYAIATTAALSAFLGANKLALPAAGASDEKTTGEIAAAISPAIVAIKCLP